MNPKQSRLITRSAASCVAAASAGAAEKGDLILRDGKLLTVGRDFLIKPAIVVKDGSIHVAFSPDKPNEALLKEKRNITRKDLDVATPNNPVVLTRAGGHSSVGNSLALKLAGITRTTEDPKSGLIEHFPDGEPNGIIRERSDLYRRLVPRDTWAQMKPGYVKMLHHLFALRITSMESATGSLDDEPVGKGGVANPGPVLTFRRFRQIAAETVIPRITTYISYPGAERLKQYPHHTGYGDIKVRLGPIGENPAPQLGYGVQIIHG